MSEELKEVSTEEEIVEEKELVKSEETLEKETTDEEIKENNRLLRKLKKYTEKYNFKYADYLFDYVKMCKEKENEEKDADGKAPVQKEGECITIHKFSEGEEVWVAEYGAKHENKPFETISNIYKFRPKKFIVREVILNKIIRYKFKDSHSVFEECMVFKTEEEAKIKCNELNNN